MSMKIIVDVRESVVYDKMLQFVSQQNISENTIEIKSMPLHIGDIYVTTNDDKHVCVIERKSLSDFISSIKDGRYKEQSHRLLHTTNMHPHNIVYIVEGAMHQIKKPMEKKMLYGAMTSLQFYKGVSIIRTMNLHETVEYVLHFTEKVAKNQKESLSLKYENKGAAGDPNTMEEGGTEGEGKGKSGNSSSGIEEEDQSCEGVLYSSFIVKKNKKDNITPFNIGNIILSQIPNVGSKVAEAIMQKYDNNLIKFLHALNDENEITKMKEITFSNGRKIPSSSVSSMRKYIYHSEIAPPTNNV